jgi:hypothetical protein
MYTKVTSLPNLYIRNIIPDDMSIPLLEYLAQSGWGYADFHVGVNFAFIEFCEVELPIYGVLRSSALPRCSGLFCAMAHILPPHTGVCCLRYVAY